MLKRTVPKVNILGGGNGKGLVENIVTNQYVMMYEEKQQPITELVKKAVK